MKELFPVNVVTGSGLGISYSSMAQVGEVVPAKPFGEAELRCYNNIATGNLIVFDHPVIVMERNFPVKIQFVYNSMAADETKVWHFAHKKFKSPFRSPTDKSQSMVLIEEDGHETTYSLFSTTDTPTWFPPHCGEGRPYLQYNNDLNLWVWFNPKTRVTEHYNQEGMLLSRFDPLMRETRYEYNADGSLKTIHAPSGDQYTLVKIAHIDGSYELSCYQKKTDGNLTLLQSWQIDSKQRVEKTFIYSSEDMVPAYSIEYTYDPQAQRARQLTNITQTDRSKISFSYDLTGEPRLSRVALGADLTSVFADYSYNVGKQAYCQKGPDGYSYYSVNALNQLTRLEQQTGLVGFDAQSNVTSIEYDADNQLSALTHPNGSHETFSYFKINGLNVYGLLEQHVMPNGQRITHFYDENHYCNLMAEVRSLNETNTENKYFVYDYHIRCKGQGSYAGLGTGLCFVVSSEGRVTENRYDELGDVASSRIYLDGRYIKTQPPSYQLSVIAMRKWLETQDLSRVSLKTYERDMYGQIQLTHNFTAVDEKGMGIENSQTGVVNTFKNIFGTTTQVSVRQAQNTVPAVTNYIVDALQRPVQITDALQQVTRCQYDQPADNDSTKQITIYPNKRKQIIEKNSQGLIPKVNVLVEVDGVEENHETTYKWSTVGWAVWLTTDPDGNQRLEFNDHLGQLAFTVSKTGIVKRIVNNEQNRYRTVTHYAKTIDVAALYYNGLFPVSLMLKMEMQKAGLLDDPNNIISYEFLNDSQKIKYSVDAELCVKEYRYDADLNLLGTIQYKDPLTLDQLNDLMNGKSVVLPYDAKVDRTDKQFFDKDGLLIATQDAAGYVTEYRKNGAGWISESIVYATAAAINWDNTVSPIANPEKDAHTYFYYNNRGGCELIIDAEGYVTTKSYLANGLTDIVRRYANPLNTKQFNSTERPILPEVSKEDEVIQHTYDLLERRVKTHHLQEQFQQKTAFDCMGNTISQSISDDNVFDNENSLLNGDNYRATINKFDGFGRKIAIAEPLVAEKIAQVEKDSTLTANKKAEIINTLWNHFSTRFTYNASGQEIKRVVSIASLDKVALADISPVLAKDIPTFTYYDEEFRPVVQFTILEDNRVIIHKDTIDNFDEVISTKQYSQVSHAFPQEWIAKLTGGVLDNQLQAILDQLEEESDPVIGKTYNKRGDLVQLTDAMDFPTKRLINSFGECYEEQQCLSSKTPSLLIKQDFDVRGLVTETTRTADNAATITIKKAYDHPLGKCTQLIDELGCQSDFDYDRLARRTLIAKTVNGQLIEEKYQFDSFSRFKEFLDAYNNPTIYSYKREQREQTVRFAIDGIKNTRKYNAFNDTICHTDALGNQSIWTHNALGQDATFKNPLGAVDSWQYNLMDKMIAKQNALGIQTAYAVDGMGDILEVIRDAGPEGQGYLNNTTAYHRNVLGLATSIVDPRGIFMVQHFDKNRNLLTALNDPSRENYQGLDLLQTNQYNAQNQIIATTQNSVSSANQYQQDFIIDALARKVGNTIDPNGLRLTSIQELNAKGQSVKITNAEGAVSWQIFNVLGQKCYEVDPLGDVKGWTYNKNGLIVQAVTYGTGLTSEQLKQVTIQTTPKALAENIGVDSKNDAQVYYFYDACDRERFSIEVVWDSWNQVFKGIVNEKQYDLNSKISKTIVYDQTISVDQIASETLEQVEARVKAIADPNYDPRTYFLYNEAGQLRFKIDSENYIQEKRYDAAGQEIITVIYAEKLLSPSEIAKLPTKDVLSHLTLNAARDRYTYRFFDALGRCVFKVHGEGSVIGYTLDENANELTQCKFDKTVTLPADYDVLKQTLASFTPNPEKDIIIVHRYDANNRRIKTKDPMQNEEIYSYDAVNNLIQRIDKMKSEWLFGYDGAKREISKTAPAIEVTETERLDNGSIQVKDRRTFKPVSTKVRNKIGLITLQTFAQGTADERKIAMRLNDRGQLTGTDITDVPIDNGTPLQAGYRPETNETLSNLIIYDAKKRKVAFCDERGYWTFYVRDNRGKLVFTVQPGGATTQRIRDTQGRLIKKIHYATAFEFPISQPSTVTSLSCDQLSDYYKSHTNVNDRVTTYKRDLRGYPTEIDAGEVYCRVPSGAADDRMAAHKHYEYNAFGQVVVENVWLNSHSIQKTISWYSRNSKEIIKAESEGLYNQTAPSFIVDLTHYNSFSDKIENYQYTKPLAQELAPNTPVAVIQNWLVGHNTPDDRHFTWEYNLNALPLAEYRLNVVRQVVILDASGVPSLENKNYPKLLINGYEYDALSRKIAVLTSNGGIQRSFYNAVGNVIAQTEVEQTNNGLTAPVVPLTYFGVNAHGQSVLNQKFKAGAVLPVTDSFPKPLDPNAQDRIEMRLYDVRGKVLIEQDAIGNPKNTSYNRIGKTSRNWQQITNWVQAAKNSPSFSLAAKHIDAKAYQYNDFGLASAEITTRDNNVISAIYSQYNTFGQTIAKGLSPDKMEEFTDYDTLGHIWRTNRSGSYVITLNNFIGMEFYRLESQVKGSIASLNYGDIANFLHVTPAEDLARTEKNRDIQGRLRDVTFPASYVDLPTDLDIIPLDICVGSYYKAFGEISISWPTVQETTYSAKFYLWAKGDNENKAEEFEIKTIKGRSGIDVSSLSTDDYNYRVEYFFASPANPSFAPEKIAESSGEIQLVTSHSLTSKHCIPYQVAKNIVEFSGYTSGLTSVEIWQDNKQIGTTHPVTNNQLDMSAYPSGIYQFKPIFTDTTKELSLPLTVYTQNPVAEGQPALSYEMQAEIWLNTLDDHAEFNWQLPKEFENNTVSLSCTYESDDAKEYTQSWLIKPDAPRTTYTDKDGKKIESNISFDHPVVTLKYVSFAVQITIGEAQESLTFYNETQPPQNKLQPAELDLIHYYTYPAKFVVYISPWKNLTSTPKVLFLNTNLGTQAVKTQIEPLGYTSEGFTLDVSGFGLGIYPFWLSTEEEPAKVFEGSFSVLKGNACFLGPFGKQPDDETHSVRPIRSFDYDRWNNKTSEKDSFDHETQFAYNDENDKIQEILPPTDVMGEQGQLTKNFSMQTKYGYNERGMQIGESWLLSSGQYKTQAWLCDNVHPIVHILADGTKDLKQLWDAFGQIYCERNSLDNSWLREHDLNGNVISLTTPMNRHSYWKFNERNELIENKNNANHSWRYNRDAMGNVSESYLPMGQETVMIYNHNHSVVKQINPDGLSNTWERDYFSNVLFLTDLGGGITSFTYNGRNQITSQQRVGGQASPYVNLVPKTYSIFDPYTGQYINQTVYQLDPVTPGYLNQHLEFKYAFGQRVALIDHIRSLSTSYGINVEGRLESVRMINTQTNEVLREQEGKVDALGREIYSHDRKATCLTYFDDEGNRRCVMLNAKDENGQDVSNENWYKYNKLNNLLISGALVNGEIQAARAGDYEFEYQGPVRSAEIKTISPMNKVRADLVYYPDGMLWQTNYPSTGEHVTRGYNDQGLLNLYLNTANNQTITLFLRQVEYNNNDQTEHETSRQLQEDGKTSTSTSNYIYNPVTGLLDNRGTTQEIPKTPTVYYGSKYSYLTKNHAELSAIATTRIQGKKTSAGTVSRYQGPNGELNAVMNAASEGDNSHSENRYFLSTPDNLILKRLINMRNISDYFYSTNGDALGSVTSMISSLGRRHFQLGAGLLHGRPSTMAGGGMGQVWSRAFNPSKSELYTVARPMNFSDSDANQKIPKHKALKHNGLLQAGGLHGGTDSLGDGYRLYTVTAGETYESIAQKEFGDANLGSLISRANGGQSLTDGEVIQIPQLMVSHNGASVAMPYQILVSIIEGNLSPYIPIPKERHKFLKKLISYLAIGISLILVVPSGGLSIGLGLQVATLLGLEEGLSLLVVEAIMSGLVDAAVQGVLVGLGVKEFSLAESISVAFSTFGAGWAAQAGNVIGAGSQAINTEVLLERSIRLATVNIAEQLSLMALGKQDHLDFTQVSAVLLSSAIDPQLEKINSGIPQSLRAQSSNLLHTVSSTAINKALKGHVSMEDVAAQMLANGIQIAITPAIMHGLDWADEHIFNPATAQRAQQSTALPASQRKPVNASKNNVHRLPPAQANKPAETPQKFMSRMGVEGELEAFDEVWEQFYEGQTANQNSYIPSLYDGSESQATQYNRFAMWQSDKPQIYNNNLFSALASTGLDRINDTVSMVSKTIGSIDAEFHLSEMARHMEPARLEPSWSERIGAVLPGTKWGDEAALYYATKQIQTGNPLWAIPGVFASLWTPTTAFDTLVTIGPEAILTGVKTSVNVANKLSNSRFGFFAGRNSRSAANIAVEVPNSSPLRAHIEANVAQTRKGIDSSSFLSHSAREHQLSIGYLPDEWGMINLKKGDVIYGGLPGQSAYYTSLDTVLSSHGNKALLYDALQVSPHPRQGFRNQIGIYEVSRDIRVSHGTVSANPSFGTGGGQQYLVRNFSTSLELRNQLSLEEFYEHQLQRYSVRP